jgi:hypothetical protein
VVLLKVLLELHHHLKLHLLKPLLPQQLLLNNCLRVPLLHSLSDPHLQLLNIVSLVNSLLLLHTYTNPHSSAPGDRTHIPSNATPVYEILSADMARVKSRAPASFAAQVNDAEKRLNILFDHLNNETLVKPDTIAMLVDISNALQGRDFDRAGVVLTEMMRVKLEAEGAHWMVGVKRLVAMSKATPV